VIGLILLVNKSFDVEIQYQWSNFNSF